MSVNTKMLKELLAWLVAAFGKDVVVEVIDKIKSQFRKYFKNKNILILGAKQTGKTSLIYLLKHGQPYTIGGDGEVEPPNPTAFTAIVDKKVKLNEDSWAKIKKDIPGDIKLRETWEEAVKLIKPHGIIYMIDGRLDNEGLKKAIHEMYDHALKLYSDGLGNLSTIHMMLNYSDQWVINKIEARKKLRFVESEVDLLLSNDLSLKELKIESHSTQLSPNKKSWPEAEAAIIKFGADLVDS